MVLTLFCVRVIGFDAFLDQGRWFWRFSGLGLMVLAFFWIRVAGFDASLD